MMKVNRQENKLLHKALSRWEEEGELEAEQVAKLRATLKPEGFDWQALSYYAFMLAIGTAVVAAIVFLADDWVWSLLDEAIESPEWVKALLFGLIATLLFMAGWRRRRRKPGRMYSNEALMLLGVLASAVSLMYLSFSLRLGEHDHYSLVILAATIMYAMLGIWFPSRLVWIFAFVSFGAWFGTETGYLSDWKNYFLGMNYPLRFSLFGLGVVLLSPLLKRFQRTRELFALTQLLGLVYLFCSLWMLSIFGNYGDMASWYEVPQARFWPWMVVLLAFSVLAIYQGLRTNNTLLRDVGVTFLAINLYSRFFEFGWDRLNRALFFTVLAISFWLIGRFAERIWTSIGSKKTNQSPTNQS